MTPTLVQRTMIFEGIDLSLGQEDFPQGIVPNAVLQSSRHYLDSFVLQQARRTSERIGFAWVALVDAPSTYEALQAAYAHSQATGDPLPISNQYCQDVLFTTTEVNVACRFWHDVNHVRRGRDFSAVQEIELALWHLDQLEEAGIPRESVVCRLLHADMIGQTLCSAVLGRFPHNQWAFDLACLRLGIDDALVYESESATPLTAEVSEPPSLAQTRARREPAGV